MGSIAVVRNTEVAQELRDRGAAVIECLESAALDRALAPVVAGLDAIVVGSDVRDPIQTVQRAYRLDPSVSVLLLGTSEQCNALRDALRFTPFIGKDVGCHDVGLSGVAAAVDRAAERTRLRRSHQLRLAAANTGLTRERPAASTPPREQFLAHLVEAAPIGILALDDRQRVLSLNPQASRLLGHSERESLGLPLEVSWLGATRESWAALLSRADVAANPETSSFERAGGMVLEVRLVTLADSSGRGHLVLLQDITERTRVAELRATSIRQAEEASRLKDEFMAMVSHELRTPMNAILGWVRLLRGGQLPAASQPHALDVIERNASAQARLIEDLLDVSRIIAGKMHLDLQPTSLAGVLTQATEAVWVAASARQIHLQVEVAHELPELLADPDRLRQVVWNLLSNAVKFSPPGGTVQVKATRSESGVEITISDRGEGIPPEALPYIFDSFRQAEGGTTRKHGGLGLGLAIARRLVELHGGTLSASSEGRGQGATFCLRLPLSPSASHEDVSLYPRITPPHASSVLAGVRILVVDGEEDTREMLALLLESSGARVQLAASGAEGSRLFEAEPPDLVLSELGLPDESGYQFLRRLRSLGGPVGSRVPVIALTAHARAEDRKQALSAGFMAHTVKPFDPQELRALIASLVRSSRAPLD